MKSLTTKQMDMLWWIVDCSVTGEEVIKKVGKMKYEKYYPLYRITKNWAFKEVAFRYINYIRRNKKKN